MSETRDFEDHDGAGAAAAEGAGGLLAFAGGLISGPYGPVARLGPSRLPLERRTLDGMRWWYGRLAYLVWTDTASMALLNGALVSDLLGTDYVLLDGHHRPPWHPCPGVDEPDIAYISEPPGNMSSIDLMTRLIATIRR